MISNVLICIGIFCIFLLVSIYIGDDGPHSEELQARKAVSKGLTQNYQAAMAAWSAFATVFSSAVIKAKMKPAVTAAIWSGGMATGTGVTYGMLKAASQLENMSSQKFHPTHQQLLLVIQLLLALHLLLVLQLHLLLHLLLHPFQIMR